MIALGALKAGASGFLLKDTPPAQLLAGPAKAGGLHHKWRFSHIGGKLIP